ncbi:fimbrial operon regulator [Proteus mirabilis]|uniref:Fimbrial operon regulator n=3 Tax=Proteus mirabilis TaxID=584 RepID=A0A2X2DVB5_PROMI|nr:fimbrial operon regulator [Proteus mirabilis]
MIYPIFIKLIENRLWKEKNTKLIKTYDTKAIHQYLGKEIRSKRKAIGLTGEDLAKKLNVSQQQVSRYETAESKISFEKLLLISDVLDLNIQYLLKVIISDKFKIISDD